MPIPKDNEIEIPLLHLIYSLGKEVKPSNIYSILEDYFKLTDEERKKLQKSGKDTVFRNRIKWARQALVNKGFLDGSQRGIWKITDAGIKNLERLGLTNKKFPLGFKNKIYNIIQEKQEKLLSEEDEALLQLVIEEVLPDGPKNFPEDFITHSCSFKEIELPGTELFIDGLLRTVIVSPKGYFRFEAKNPPEAKYIIYANKKGITRMKIPDDNLIIFKAVTAYEKYVSDTIKKSFELFLLFTNDETKAEILTKLLKERLEFKDIIK